MIPKYHRPHSPAVRYVLHRGKKRHGSFLTVAWVGCQHHSRRGVHIAKKVAKYATQRNAAKRAAYAAIFSHGGLDLDPGGLFFITINKHSTDKRYHLMTLSGADSVYHRVLGSIELDIRSFIRYYQRIHG